MDKLTIKSARPFGPRDPDEGHRAATPLELLFDLVTVIAVAAAAAGLHHAIAEGHAAEGIAIFLMAFFAIWWAWMNYTWFASAYDNDGPVFRLLTCWIMAGSLTMAAGIPNLSTALDLRLTVLGYVIMRIGMIALWLIAARTDLAHSRTAISYAVGIALAQGYWTGLLWQSPVGGMATFAALFMIGVAIELAVPAVAERQGTTPWHRHHIIERYGLLAIIVMGEILLAATSSLMAGADRLGLTEPLVHVAVSALIVTIVIWWLYFTPDDHLASNRLQRALLWGYGHFAVFASVAAVGAGFAVLVDILTGASEASLRAGDMAVAIPLAIYMASLWLLRDRFNLSGSGRHVLLVFAVLVAIAGSLLPAPLELVALLSVASVFARSHVVRKQQSLADHP